MTTRNPWTRSQLLVACALYCRTPFGKITAGNPEIVRIAALIGRSPASLSMKMCNIASLDPAITSTGRSGLGNASASDRAMWQEMNSDWEKFAVESQAALASLGETTALEENEEDSVSELHPREGIDYPVQSTTRVGQSFFRSAVLSAYDQKCCISGLSIPSLLVASHIVPWSHDPCNRVNPTNGLLLSALHDRAFDIGLMTINDDMTVRVSHSEIEDEFFSRAILAFNGDPIRLPNRFQPDRNFLAYHREHIFVG